METPEQIEVEAGTTLTLTWPGGGVDRIPAAVLRASCGCASCLAGADRPRLIAVAGVRIVDARIVGGYGVNFTFEPDGHHTGIYPYHRLRALGETIANGEG